MKIKWGALAVDGRGKLGGHVAASGLGGAYLRTKVTPNNPQTQSQAVARDAFSRISQAWSSLTEAQRVAWNEAVSLWKETNIFGDLKKPSGKELFQRLNLELKIASFPAIILPPEKLPMPILKFTNPIINTGAGIFVLDQVVYSLDYRIVTYATPPVTQGTTNYKSKLRMINVTSGSSTNNTPRYNDYISIMGQPSPSDVVYAGFAIILKNGQKSQMQLAKAVIT